MRLHAMLLEYGTVAVATLLQPHTLPASCIMQTFSVVWYIFCVITYCKLVSLSAGYIILVLLYIFEFLVNVRCPPSRPGLQAHLSPAQLSLTLTPPADHGFPPTSHADRLCVCADDQLFLPYYSFKLWDAMRSSNPESQPITGGKV
jgi:hypothetical protein